MAYTFEYGFAQVADLHAEVQSQPGRSKPRIDSIQLQGQRYQPTQRFWSSFFRRFQASENIFRYFTPAEVFARISERARDESFRYCVERSNTGRTRLLAVTSPDRPVMQFGELETLARRYDCREFDYEDGVVTSAHVPRSGDHAIQIGGDEFRHRYLLDTPVDGYGLPRIHLAMLRMVCTNGMVGYAPAFRSEISVGKDVGHGIQRALDSFDNFNGYTALRQRLDSAQRSWASIHETQELYRVLAQLEMSRDVEKKSVLADYYRCTGRVHELYGLANLDALSVKRQRVLPARCRVYDLMNFASEVGTHHATTRGNRLLQGYLGTLISDEYDLEGTGEQVGEFDDFFISDKEPETQASRRPSRAGSKKRQPRDQFTSLN